MLADAKTAIQAYYKAHAALYDGKPKDMAAEHARLFAALKTSLAKAGYYDAKSIRAEIAKVYVGTAVQKAEYVNSTLREWATSAAQVNP